MLKDNIREQRNLHHLSQMELSKKLGVDKSTISSWEVGRTEPKMGMIERMANIFGIQKSELIGEYNQSLDPDTRDYQSNISDDERLMLEAYRQLSMAQRMVVYANMLKEANNGKENETS